MGHMYRASKASLEGPEMSEAHDMSMLPQSVLAKPAKGVGAGQRLQSGNSSWHGGGNRMAVLPGSSSGGRAAQAVSATRGQ